MHVLPQTFTRHCSFGSITWFCLKAIGTAQRILQPTGNSSGVVRGHSLSSKLKRHQSSSTGLTSASKYETHDSRSGFHRFEISTDYINGYRKRLSMVFASLRREGRRSSWYMRASFKGTSAPGISRRRAPTLPYL